MSQSPSAIIIGAGPSGIAMAHEMKHELGFEDFTIYEKLDGVGGTWATNRYPGCGCDVPTHLYSFSFNLNPDWSKELCDQDEILEYMNSTVDKFSLRPHIHTSIECLSAIWRPDFQDWAVQFKDLKTDIEYTRYATILICAVGGISYPRDVKFEGMEKFDGEGKAMFHTARWPTDWGKDGLDGARGKRVAVVGNGCSAAQLVPKLTEVAASVTQYARSPQWYHERPNRSFTRLERFFFRYVPLWQRYHRLELFIANDNLVKTYMPGSSATGKREKVETHAKDYILANTPEKYHSFIVPSFPLGCKRRIFDPNYLSSLHSSNLTVLPEGLQEITETGITSTTGITTDFDVIILATGFQVTQFLAPMHITGVHPETSLADYWASTRGAQAHWGTLISSFPNLGILFGPNTFPAHNSALFACETSIAYLSRVLLAPIIDRRARVVEVTKAAEDLWANKIQEKLKGAVFEAGCSNWYINEYGRNVASWPGLARDYWLRSWWAAVRGQGIEMSGGEASSSVWLANMVLRRVRATKMRTWVVLLLALALGRSRMRGKEKEGLDEAKSTVIDVLRRQRESLIPSVIQALILGAAASVH